MLLHFILPSFVFLKAFRFHCLENSNFISWLNSFSLRAQAAFVLTRRALLCRKYPWDANQGRPIEKQLSCCRNSLLVIKALSILVKFSPRNWVGQLSSEPGVMTKPPPRLSCSLHPKSFRTCNWYGLRFDSGSQAFWCFPSFLAKKTQPVLLSHLE